MTDTSLRLPWLQQPPSPGRATLVPWSFPCWRELGMSRGADLRKGAIVLLGVGVLFAGLAACGPLKTQGQRCDPRTETWAHDNSHWVLQCKPNGRWKRALTEAQANAFWAAVAAKQQQQQPPPPPPTPVVAPS